MTSDARHVPERQSARAPHDKLPRLPPTAAQQPEPIVYPLRSSSVPMRARPAALAGRQSMACTDLLPRRLAGFVSADCSQHTPGRRTGPVHRPTHVPNTSASSESAALGTTAGRQHRTRGEHSRLMRQLLHQASRNLRLSGGPPDSHPFTLRLKRSCPTHYLVPTYYHCAITFPAKLAIFPLWPMQ